MISSISGWCKYVSVSFTLVCFFSAIVRAEELPDAEELLDRTPVSLTPSFTTEFEDRQQISKISCNLEDLYDVGCFIEAPSLEEGKPGPFALRKYRFAPYAIDENTTLRAFLDTACSDGKMQWAVIRNGIHIWPVSRQPGNEDYLDDVVVSLDLKGVSLLEAVKAWAEAVNKIAQPDKHGVEIRTPTVLRFLANKNYPTPESMLREGVVTLQVDNVSAREALCGILGASSEWIHFRYFHVPSKEDVLWMYSRKKEMLARPEITATERVRLNEQEGHGRPLLTEEPKVVLVEPVKAQE